MKNRNNEGSSKYPSKKQAKALDKELAESVEREIKSINTPLETDIVAEARQLKYLVDEGFYDNANKGRPNYRPTIKIDMNEMDEVALEVWKREARKLAKVAGVSQHIAQSAFLNVCLRKYFKSLGLI